MFLILSTLIDDVSDKAFFENLYRSYENQMFFVANRILNNNQLSEDAVQNAFIKIATNIKTLRELNETQVKQYLFITAKNSALDIAKNNLNFETISLETNDLSDKLDFEDKINNVDDKNLVISVLKKLPKKYTDVMYLHFVVGLNKKEVAEVLNMNLNTVRQQIKRGKNMFIEIYEKEANG